MGNDLEFFLMAGSRREELTQFDTYHSNCECKRICVKLFFTVATCPVGQGGCVLPNQEEKPALRVVALVADLYLQVDAPAFDGHVDAQSAEVVTQVLRWHLQVDYGEFAYAPWVDAEKHRQHAF